MLHLIMFAVLEVTVNAGQQVTVNARQQLSVSTPVNQMGQETCLLALRANVRKTNSSQAPEAVAAYKWWRAKHKTRAANVKESMSEFEKFIATQNDSVDACSSKLLESKRSLDGLLKDLFSLSNQVEAHELILQTEIENLHFTMMAEKAVIVRYEAAEKDCREQILKAKEEMSQYQRELAELDQIAKPSVRYAHAMSVSRAPTSFAARNHSDLIERPRDVASFVDAEPWTRDRCFQFLGFVQARQNKSVALGRRIVPEELQGQSSCDMQREELQKVFTKTYIEIKDLRNDAEGRTSMRKCMEPAISIKVSSLVSLVAQKDLATERIQSATLSLSALDPVLELVKKRTSKLYNHVHDVLAPECKEASQASEALQRIREMIISLEHCPGRNDFQLEIPREEEKEDEEEDTPEELGRPSSSGGIKLTR